MANRLTGSHFAREWWSLHLWSELLNVLLRDLCCEVSQFDLKSVTSVDNYSLGVVFTVIFFVFEGSEVFPIFI